jgi:hypothetical protein
LSAESIKRMKPEAAFAYLLDQVQKAVGFRQLAQKAAADLAPYKHPKLSAVALPGDDNKPIVSEIRNIIVDPKERRS